MKTKRLSLITLTLGLALALILGVFATLTRATPGNPASDPGPNTHNAPLTSSISLTYDELISAATVTSHTFAVHAMQTGLLTATHGVYSGTMVVTPTRPLYPGELVQATATTRTLNITGEQPLSPTVWQFRTRTSNSSGAFAAHPVSPTIGGNNSYGIAMGDLNGDRYLDAVVANYDSFAQRVYLNDGTGRFVTPVISPTFGAGNSSAIALGDVDNDGDLDAVVANYFQFHDVYLNNGLGGFYPHPVSPTFGILGQSTAIELGDINGDGYLDAIVANRAREYVYLNDGAGGFSPHPSSNSFGAGDGSSRDVSLGDVDGDGDLDAVVAQYATQQGVYLNDGTGVFSPRPISYTFGPADSQSWGIALGDVNGDGHADAVVANYEQPQDVYLNDGTGLFTPNLVSPTFGTNHWSYAVVLGDVNGDGYLDAVVANHDNPQDVYLNDGTGSFSLQPLFPTFGTGGESEDDSQDVALGDIDGDGDLDALVANRTGYAQTVWLNRNLCDLAIAKSASSDRGSPGVPLTFTLTFTNHGLQMATHIIVEDSDDLPEGLWSVTSTVPLTQTPGITYQWQIERLAPGQGGVITISGLLMGSLYDGAVLTNRALITTTDIDTDTFNNQAAVSITVDTEAPAPPVLLGPANATLTRTTVLTLAWRASSSADAVGYLLQWQGLELDLGDVTTYNTGLLADGAYTWTVAAYDKLDHISPYTDSWSFEIDSTPPVPPMLVTPFLDVINDPTPTLSWSSSPSADTAGYLLNWNGVVSDVGAIRNVTLAPLADGPYTWTVAAYDHLGNVGDYAASRSFTVDTVGPEPPTLVSPADGAFIGSDSVTLVWSASPSPDAEGYKLDWNGNITDTSSAISYTIGSLSDGVYTWTVAAYDAVNDGAYATAWSFVVSTTLPVLNLTKSVDLGDLLEAQPGGIVTYTLVLSNASEGIAQDVTLLDELPPGLSFEAWVEQGLARLTPDVEWGPHNIEGHSAYTISFAARVSASSEFSGQTINNTAYYDAANAPSGSASVSIPVAGSPRVLAVSPPNAAQDVLLDAAVVITFSKVMSTTSLNIGMSPDPGGQSPEWNGAGTVITLSHDLFAQRTTYNIGLDASDLLGKHIVGSPYNWYFVTEGDYYAVYLPLALKLPAQVNHSSARPRR